MTHGTAGETVKQLLELQRQGDVDAAASMFATPFDFLLPHAPGVPWIPTVVDSPAGMLHFYHLLAEHLEMIEFTPDVIAQDGEDVVVAGRILSVVRSTGRQIRSPFSIRITVHDGLIVRYHMLEDSWAVAQSMDSVPESSEHQ